MTSQHQAGRRLQDAWSAYDTLHAMWPWYRDYGKRDEWFARIEDQRTRIEAAIRQREEAGE